MLESRTRGSGLGERQKDLNRIFLVVRLGARVDALLGRMNGAKSDYRKTEVQQKSTSQPQSDWPVSKD